MPYRSLPPRPPGAASLLERLLAQLLGWTAWAVFMLMGLVFALSLLFWLVVATLVSVVASLFTGRPAAVTLLWRRYRDMTRQRWPQRRPGASARADAAPSSAASAPGGIEDVRWRDLPPEPAPGRTSAER